MKGIASPGEAGENAWEGALAGTGGASPGQDEDLAWLVPGLGSHQRTSLSRLGCRAETAPAWICQG